MDRRVQASSVLSAKFWLGFAVVLPVGFIAAWPINWWLSRAQVKQHSH